MVLWASARNHPSGPHPWRGKQFPQRFDGELLHRERDRHAGEAGDDRRDAADANATRLARLRVHLLIEVGHHGGGDAVQAAGGLRGGENAGDDETRESRRQFMDHEEGIDRVDARQTRIKMIGELAIEQVESRADGEDEHS